MSLPLCQFCNQGGKKLLTGHPDSNKLCVAMLRAEQAECQNCQTHVKCMSKLGTGLMHYCKSLKHSQPLPAAMLSYVICVALKHACCTHVMPLTSNWCLSWLCSHTASPCMTAYKSGNSVWLLCLSKIPSLLLNEHLQSPSLCFSGHMYA